MSANFEHKGKLMLDMSDRQRENESTRRAINGKYGRLSWLSKPPDQTSFC
jgi:hypothetical protein